MHMQQLYYYWEVAEVFNRQEIQPIKLLSSKYLIRPTVIFDYT